MRPRSAAPDAPGTVRVIRSPKARTDSMLFMVTALLFKILAAGVTCGPIGVTGYVKTSIFSNRRAEENFPNSDESHAEDSLARGLHWAANYRFRVSGRRGGQWPPAESS